MLLVERGGSWVEGVGFGVEVLGVGVEGLVIRIWVGVRVFLSEFEGIGGSG